MIRRVACAALAFFLLAPGAVAAGGGGVASPADSTAASDSLASFASIAWSMLPDRRYLASPTITVMSSAFSGRAERLLGYETYRATPSQCAWMGAAAGMTAGGAVGAFGMMTGAWGEDETWAIAGAAAALGAIYGGLFKADDPDWNLHIRWEPRRER